MATRKYIPAKLKHDAIVEALREVRFDMATVPEILFGRLADSAAWKAFEQRGMPAYDIPASLRQVTPNLRYQPVFELLNADKNRAVRIGAQVLSYHRLPPYENWMQFKPELGATTDGLFAKADGLTVRRLGLRYINALRPELHRIRSISELDLKVVVETEAVAADVNVNFTTDLSDDTQCTVRVATTEFVRGTLPKNTSVLIDVDVFTNEAFATQDADKVKQWVDFDHEREKEQFFRLLTHETIDMIEDK